MADNPDSNLADVLLGGDEDVAQVGETQEEAPQANVITQQLETDPEYRAQVADYITQLAAAQVGAAQAPQEQQQAAPQVSPIDQADAGIDELQRQIEAFLQMDEKDPNKDYRQYEEWKVQLSRLENYRARLDRQERLDMARRLSPEGSERIVEEFIQQEGRSQARRIGKNHVSSYANRVRDLAKQLNANVRSDPDSLRNALQNAIGPMAFQEYVEASMKKGGSMREGAAPSESYADGRTPEAQQGEFDDASPEERQFLRAMGLIQGEERQAGVRQVDRGFEFDVTRGRRNPRE